jgi:hypothetical protein
LDAITHGKIDEPCVDRVVPLVGIVGQHEAVILVGTQETLAAPARAHDQQRERHGRRAAFGHACAQHHAMDVAVDLGDDALDVGRRQPVVEQRLGEFDLRALGGPVVVDPVLECPQHVELAQHAGTGRTQRVGPGDETQRPAVAVHDRHMAPAAPAQPADDAIEMLLGAYRYRIARHHRCQRCCRIGLEGDPRDDVALGQKTRQPAGGIDRQQGGTSACGKRRDRGADGLGLPAHRRRLHRFAGIPEEEGKCGARGHGGRVS